MANTKQITDSGARKKAKRLLRAAYKKAFAGLSPKDKTRFRKSETPGLRKWIAESQGKAE